MKIPKLSLLWTFILLVATLKAQILTLEGNVLDSKTNTGIPYVNIGFPTHSIGTSSNELGGYIIKIPKERMSDTLVFSCIGYVSYRLAVKDINPKVLKKVLMQPTDINLNEVVVKSLDAHKIIKEVLKQREKNYNTEPVKMQLFCREITKEKDTEQYFYQSEGIVEVYKSSVKKNNDHVRLMKGRKKNLPSIISRGNKQYSLPLIVNGPTAAVTLDIIKSPQFFLMHMDQFKLIHTGYELVNDQLAYIIHFTPTDSSQRALFPNDADFVKGKMYIDTATKALVRTEFDLSIRGLRVMNIEYNNDKSPIELLKRSYVVNYAPYQNKLYFKSANVENTYNYKGNIATITNKLECLVTEITTENVKRFPLKEQIGENESLGENISNFDDSFWEDFNFIKSTAPIQETLPTTTATKEKDDETLTLAKTEKKVKEILSIEKRNSKSVIFFKGSFTEAKEAAKQQNKLIFIDVYTDWCKPCKVMAAEAFENEEIADLMNAFFINFKADAERSGQQIASQYMVQAYPTTLVINALGELVTSNRGYGGVAPFKRQLEEVINNTQYGKIYLKMQQNFANKQRDITFLLAFAQLKRKLGLSTESLTDVLVKEMPVDTLLKLEFQQFLYQFSNAIEGKTFDFFLKHKDQPIFNAKLKSLIPINVNLAVKEKDKNHLSKTLTANTSIINDPSVSEEINEQWTLTYYAKVGSKDKTYHETATLLMTQHYLPKLEIAKSQSNDDALSYYLTKIEKIGLHYAENIKDKKLLEQMATIINKAYEAHDCGSLLSVYSQILYRMKETDRAKELMKKAVALSNNLEEMLEILEKMNTGVF